MRKLLINLQFGKQWDWLEKYRDNCNTLEQYGWDWVFVTDEDLQSKGNFKVVPMQLQEFADLIKDKFGVRPNYNLVNGIVSAHFSGYMPAYAYLFPELVKGYDFWGHTNLDLVYGRLDRFFPDEFFADCDIFGNDPNAMNGIFSLFRNYDFINRLFKEVVGWERIFSDKGWYAFDEKEMTEVVRKAHAEGRIRFKSGHWAGSEAQGEIPILLDDGTLINKNDGKEMAMYHFSISKRYPDLRKKVLV
jgi:hypothetical protein